MTSTRPSPRPERAAGGLARLERPLRARAARRSRVVLAAGVAAVLAIGALDAARERGRCSSRALLVLPPLVVALTGRWGDTRDRGWLALAIVLGEPAGSTATESAASRSRCCSSSPAGSSRSRSRSRAPDGGRARALPACSCGVADAADGGRPAPRSCRGGAGPARAGHRRRRDVDAMLGGEQRRLGVRGAPGVRAGDARGDHAAAARSPPPRRAAAEGAIAAGGACS